MNVEVITNAMAMLRQEGLDVVLKPKAVEISVGTLKIDQKPRYADAKHVGVPGSDTTISIDGVEIAQRVQAIDLRLAVGEATHAIVTVGVLL